MGGGKGGGKGGGGIDIPNINIPPSPWEKALADMSLQYYTKTDPLRNMFYQDFGQFLRPGMSAEYNPYIEPLSIYQANRSQMSSPYAPGGGGGASASGVGTTGGTGTIGGTYSGNGTATGTGGTPISSNFYNIPSTQEITQNLRYAYGGGTSGPYAQAQQGQQYLQNLGYNPFMADTLPNIPSEGTPEWNPWLSSTANEIRTNALQKAMQNQAVNQSVQSSSTVPASSPFSGSMASSAKYNPYNLPAYAPLYQLARTGLESQYGQARNNIMASSPRGGALAENLANLEMGRAQQAGALPATIAAPIIQDLYNKAYGSAFSAPGTAMSGMQGAGSLYNTTQGINANATMQAAGLGAQQAALNQQAGMAGAAGLGSLVGLGIKAAGK